MTALDTLLTEFDAFFSEHRGCTTDLAGGLLDDQPRAARDQADDSSCVMWLAWDACGARIVREA
jgi:hypothetical protein